MYASVLTGTAVALYFFSRYGSRPGNARANIVVMGLVATALADLFLTLIDAEWSRLPGFVLFCVTQAIYGVYLGFEPARSPREHARPWCSSFSWASRATSPLPMR